MTAKPASEPTELSEDMELVGPGQMLKDARKALNLSIEDVAERLNFTITMVRNIEAEQFDDKLPATYTRGYLRNYAKLVELDQNEVLASYEMLGVAKIQRSEMQSFSKVMKKRAENNRLMWISYLIAALLIGSTVFWWWQLPVTTISTNNTVTNVESHSIQQEQQLDNSLKDVQQTSQSSEQSSTTNPVSQTVTDAPTPATTIADTAVDNASGSVTASENSTTETLQSDPAIVTNQAAIVEDTHSRVSDISQAEFYFAGDCWVNIYDASGERVAWGIKKAGYTMHIQGKAPFKVTLGKPELVSIKLNQQRVDLSAFGKGNIAKFTLPLANNE